MGLFTYFKHKTKKKYIRDTFEKFVSKDVVKELFDNPDKLEVAIKKVKEKTTDFVIIRINDSDLNNLPKSIEQLYIFLEAYNNIIVDNIFSSFILVYFFQADEYIDYSNERNNLVNDLIDEFKNLISIIHGSNKCLFGNFGSDYKMIFTILIPQFNEIIKKLSILNPGEKTEVFYK
jgi:hypothetical protein